MNDKIINILSTILDIDEDSITPDLKKDQMPEWDSLVTAQIIMVFENEFNRHLTDEEIENIQSIGDILKLVNGGE